VERAAFRRAALRIGSLAALGVLAFGAIAAFAAWNARKAEILARNEHTHLIRAAIDAGNTEIARGDPTLALLHYAQALRLVENDPETEWDVRVALETTLGKIPRLAFLAPLRHTSVTTVALSPVETRLVTANTLTGTVQLFETKTARQFAERTVPAQTLMVAWGADGTTLGLVSPWETEIVDGRTLASRTRPLGPPQASEGDWWFSQPRRNQDMVDWISADREALEWRDLETGARVVPPVDVPDGERLLWLSTNRRTAVFGADAMLRAVDLASGRTLLGPLAGGIGVLDPNGRWLLRFGIGGEVVDDLQDRGSPTRTLASGQYVYDAVWNADGSVLATGSRDRMAQLWDVAGGRPRSPPLHHLDQVWSLSYGDSGRLATVEGGGLARIWQEREARRERGRGWLDSMPLGAVDVSGDRMIGRLADGSIACVTLEGSRCGAPVPVPAGSERWDRVDVDATFRWALAEHQVTGHAPWFIVVDIATGDVLWEGRASATSWSRDGTLAVVLRDGTTRLWRADTGATPLDLPRGGRFLAWRHDGGALATCGDALTAWNTKDDARIWTREGRCQALGWSPDDERLAVGFGSELYVVAGDSGGDVGPVLRHPAEPTAVAWSPDGTRLATVAIDGYLRLWDVATGATITPPSLIGDFAYDLAFTADGRHVALQTSFGTADVVVSTRSGQIVTRYPVDAPRQPIPALGGYATLWDLDPGTRPVEDWVEIAELLALRRVNPSGTDTVDRDTLVALWTDLAKKYPADFGWDGGE